MKLSKTKKMNFKLFTTALLATAATAAIAPAEQDLADALVDAFADALAEAYFEDMPEHVQRRGAAVSILLYNSVKAETALIATAMATMKFITTPI